eukprot:CAMPEP_0198299258 /NCGR_PEP_ID=MMETSP1449-20131203/44051_1 /TAXON_ID=420275 /ORGANISM="Attheya septentrionalis, Strain CCMP2084" /LENGTH=497 /DNA_ID=CAMNT_0044000753 /DNA_START=53 /DNA_END=1543 /DNA_ORIENTATION=+
MASISSKLGGSIRIRIRIGTNYRVGLSSLSASDVAPTETIKAASMARMQQRRGMAVYVSGDGWTGALGSPDFVDFTRPAENSEEAFSLTEVKQYADQTPFSGVIAAAAGWGHSALIIQDPSTKEKKLMVCGRPQDFQNLLRLRRIPPFIRSPLMKRSFDQFYEPDRDQPTMFDQLIDAMIGDKHPTISTDRNLTRTVFPHFVTVPLPDDDEPIESSSVVLSASVGLTAVVGASGKLYTMGINSRGQCGVEFSNNVWTPTPVVGLSTAFPSEGRPKLQQESNIVSVALGLQHGLAIDEQGSLFSWGKGHRGQLGLGDKGQKFLDSSLVPHSLPYAMHIKHFPIPPTTTTTTPLDTRVVQVSAGWNHSAGLTKSNHVFVWGKNVAPSEDLKKQPASDMDVPLLVQGLPEGLKVMNLSCGSHHTAMLLEDGSVYAVGVSTDNAEPIVEHAVEMIPPGIVDMPARQFQSHVDRTTIVGRDGTQVLEVQLWSHEELREDAAA